MPQLSRHALNQMQLRGISAESIFQILVKPQQTVQNNDLLVYQSVVEENGKNYLIRIFVNLRKQPPLIVTVYKTSNIQKYWQ